MVFPLRAVIWTSLNFLRFLSIVISFLVFISTITSMVADGRGVKSAQQGSSEGSGIGCDYFLGTDVPVHVWGLFWAHLNHTFELILLILCILSELNWGGGPERLFSYTLPVLSRSFGTAPLGLLQMILACSNLSRELGKFPLVTNWMLFVIGILNILVGAIFKAAGKNIRSFHASRRGLANASQQTVQTSKEGHYDEKSDNKSGLPFAHRWSRKPVSQKPDPSSGGLRQLRYLRDGTAAGPITYPSGAGARVGVAGGGPAIIDRPSQAFVSAAGRNDARNSSLSIEVDHPTGSAPPVTTSGRQAAVPSESGATSTAGRAFAPSEVYLYDSDTDRIRVPMTQQATTHKERIGIPPLKEQVSATRSSSAFNLAKAVVTRAEEMARSRIRKPDSNQGPTATVNSHSKVSFQKPPSIGAASMSAQYHARDRCSQRGDEPWRGHLRQRSSASVQHGVGTALGGASGPIGAVGGRMPVHFPPPSHPQRVLYASQTGLSAPGRPF